MWTLNEWVSCLYSTAFYLTRSPTNTFDSWIFHVWLCNVMFLQSSAVLLQTYNVTREIRTSFMSDVVGCLPVFLNKEPVTNVKIQALLMFIQLVGYLFEVPLFTRSCWFTIMWFLKLPSKWCVIGSTRILMVLVGLLAPYVDRNSLLPLATSLPQKL